MAQLTTPLAWPNLRWPLVLSERERLSHSTTRALDIHTHMHVCINELENPFGIRTSHPLFRQQYPSRFNKPRAHIHTLSIHACGVLEPSLAPSRARDIFRKHLQFRFASEAEHVCMCSYARMLEKVFAELAKARKMTATATPSRVSTFTYTHKNRASVHICTIHFAEFGLDQSAQDEHICAALFLNLRQ